MPDSFSDFGRRFGGATGIGELMDDLGAALGGGGDFLMMGGGNPARLPELDAVWRRQMNEWLARGDAFERMLVYYDPPQGRPAFREAVAAAFNRRYGWNLTADRVAVTNGSQTAFFYLFNLLAGASGRDRQRVLLPLCPEYIGYADLGVERDLFTARRPLIAREGEHGFKYRIDFDRLELGPDIGAVCVSRPTNPSGNVLTDDEMARLMELTRRRGVPLIVDNAYGRPFPDIIFTAAEPAWDEHVVLSLSLSKLGLPGARTGIVIARPEIVRALGAMNAVMGLASGNFGPELVTPLLQSGELFRLSEEVVRPFYRERSLRAQAWAHEALAGLPYRLHRSEGALFLWVWFEGLPIPARELYLRLKRRRLLVIPGHYFFYGLDRPWDHADQCLRLTYSQDESVVREGLSLLADEVRKVYAGASVLRRP